MGLLQYYISTCPVTLKAFEQKTKMLRKCLSSFRGFYLWIFRGFFANFQNRFSDETPDGFFCFQLLNAPIDLYFDLALSDFLDIFFSLKDVIVCCVYVTTGDFKYIGIISK